MDQALFGDDDEEQKQPEIPLRVPAVADWQVSALRQSLDARGLTTMEERQALIEELVGRPLDSLRGLTMEEANRALTRLGPSTPPGKGASLWESRDKDTWIDRL